jgi:hypothetical protein
MTEVEVSHLVKVSPEVAAGLMPGLVETGAAPLRR